MWSGDGRLLAVGMGSWGGLGWWAGFALAAAGMFVSWMLFQFDGGKLDGVLGQASRSAVKAMQVKYGLPADSWPTAELLAKMRGLRAAPSAAALPAVR